MFDPFACASSLRDNLLSYIASSLPIGNHASQIELGNAFYAEWSRELFKGPFVEALPKYQTVHSLADQFKHSTERTTPESAFSLLLSRASTISWAHIDRKFTRFLGARDRLWSKYPQERDAEEAQTSIQRLWNQQLYWHQSEALRLICDDRRSVVVATGTGSGKTECYLLPLLRILTTEAPTERATPGVRAIVLFPMNALVEDQMRRLRKLLFWLNLASFNEPGDSPAHLKRMITFGRYTGDTPIGDSDPDRSKPADNIHELGELVTRSEMRRNPPDILVTNFSMLEYALLRSDDQVLFQNARVFKLLVLDEVHTYSGTVGAEVAMLLRRFRAQLSEQAKQQLPAPIFVGTSATVGSGPQSAGEMARFATNLFGSSFQSDQILFGRTTSVEGAKNLVNADQLRELSNSLVKFAKRRPHLLKLIAGRLDVDDEPNWDSYIANDLEELAIVLNACWEGMDSEIRNLDLLSHDPEVRSRQLLGQIVQRSSAARALIDHMQADGSVTIDLAELSGKFFHSGGEVDDNQREAQRTALSLLLTLLANATISGRAWFPIRFHHFVTEKKEGLLCLNAECPARSAPNGPTDGWWSKLFIQHSKTCSLCNSFIYPLVVCRKCGFTYLEAWRRPDGICLPEKDDFEARNLRFLFRPVLGLSYTAEDLAATKRALCLSCGCWFEDKESEYGKQAQADHSSRCPNARIIEIFEWSQDNSDYEMSECAACEQHYFADHEVVTPPTISPFGAATVLHPTNLDSQGLFF
jgi:hypothetical protein